MNRNAASAITNKTKLCRNPFGIFPVSRTPARMPSPRPWTATAMKNAIRMLATTFGKSWASGLWTTPPVVAKAPLASSIREERHIEDPDRHKEHHERDVDDRDVR